MRPSTLRALALCALAFVTSASAAAQTPNESSSLEQPKPAGAPAVATGGNSSGGLFGLEEMRRQLGEQRSEIEELRAAIKEQSRLIGELRSRVEHAEAASNASAPHVRQAVHATRESAGDGSGAVAAQDAKLEERVARAEEQAKKSSDAVAKQLGSLSFSGDMRFRYESFYGQQNALASSDNPAALGNPLTTRQRLRIRARLAVRGKINDEFEWGLRLATGSFADSVSMNSTLTDFFNRKPFAVNQAFITYKPKQLAGFQIQAGKFDTPWTRTEMTWDNDISPEGLSESYTRAFKKSKVKNIAFIAWQLPMLERNAAFVLGADGRVDFSASGRAGRDLALYGAQVRTEIAPTKNVTLRLSASDLYFSGTQFINPAQVFGSNIQLPVTFTIPASGTTPARTVTTQVSVPRELLVAGNGNLGLSAANTNAVNRDGRLSSGYNLVDLIARADLTRSKRWPIMLLLNFVTNTQTHDVVTAGPGGANVLLPNQEGQGIWGEFQIGKDVLRLPVDRITRGDVTLNYTFVRVEKDAVLSPFNGSDFGLSTDMRVHRFIAAYALDPRVAVSLTGFFTSRPNGLLGAFAQTPPGSLNQRLMRFQFDTILRF